MTRRNQLALAVLALSLLLSPAVTLHPAVTHIWAAGVSNAMDEVGHPGLLTFLALGALTTIPTIGFILCLLQALPGRHHVRALWNVSEPARMDDLRYRRLPSDEVLIFTAGSLGPVTFVSHGAEVALGRHAMRAALLHEEAHRRRKDVLWRLVLRGVGSGFAFSPWVARLVEAQVLRTECAADEYALRRGARRRALFEAIVAAATTPTPGLFAGVGDTGAELRLMRLVDRRVNMPAWVTARLVVLNAAIVLPAILVHLIAFAAASHAVPFTE